MMGDLSPWLRLTGRRLVFKLPAAFDQKKKSCLPLSLCSNGLQGSNPAAASAPSSSTSEASTSPALRWVPTLPYFPLVRQCRNHRFAEANFEWIWRSQFGTVDGSGQSIFSPPSPTILFNSRKLLNLGFGEAPYFNRLSSQIWIAKLEVPTLNYPTISNLPSISHFCHCCCP